MPEVTEDPEFDTPIVRSALSPNQLTQNPNGSCLHLFQPSIPTTWGDSTDAATTTEAFIPKVITVASASTHPGGGPSHGLVDTVDAHLHEILEEAPARLRGVSGLFADYNGTGEPVVPEWWSKTQNWFGSTGDGLFADVEAGVEDIKETVKDAMDGVESKAKSVTDKLLEVPPLSDAASSEYWTDSKPSMDHLTDEQRSGLWVLLGIVVAGGAFGSAMKPSSKQEHHEEKHDGEKQEHK